MSEVTKTQGAQPHVALPSDYIRTRHRESDPAAKRDVTLGKKIDKLDRRMQSSVPNRADVFEVSQLPPAAIKDFQEASGKIMKSNSKMLKWQLAASLGGAGVAMLASMITGGGWVYLAIALSVSGLGALARKLITSKMRDPRDIATLEKVIPEVGKQLRALDRPELSRPHWTDKDELARLTPAEKAQYEKVIGEVVSHNKKTGWKKRLSGWLSTGASYAGLVLPMVTSLPGAVIKGVMFGGVVLGTWLTQKFGAKMVPLKTEAVEQE